MLQDDFPFYNATCHRVSGNEKAYIQDVYHGDAYVKMYKIRNERLRGYLKNAYTW